MLKEQIFLLIMADNMEWKIPQSVVWAPELLDAGRHQSVSSSSVAAVKLKHKKGVTHTHIYTYGVQNMLFNEPYKVRLNL